jgi:hypothetical protein
VIAGSERERAGASESAGNGGQSQNAER